MTVSLLPAGVAMIVAVGLAIALARSRSEARQRLRDFHEERMRRQEVAAAAAAMERQRAAFLEILNGLGEGLLAVDRERRIVLANRRLTAMFRIEEDVVGKPLAEVVRIAAVLAGFDAALAGTESTETFPARFFAADQKIEMRAFPLPSGGIAAVAIFIDVTRVERLESIRRNFISDFSHEVRTPLAGLRSAVESFELGRDQMSVDEDHQLRRIMTRQLARLERLVDDLSELSRIESGDLRLDRHDVELRSLLDDLCEDFTDRAAQRNLAISVRGDHVLVFADALRMQQAFSNLIDNAIKYGGTDSSIDIEVSQTARNAIVRISDHGDGILPEEHERIFRRFHRVDRSRSQEVSGAGLGLAITKHLVALHQGTLAVESVPGQGATFVVTLPKAQPATARSLEKTRGRLIPFGE